MTIDECIDRIASLREEHDAICEVSDGLSIAENRRLGYYTQRNLLWEQAKREFRTLIEDWLAEKGIEGRVRSELRFDRYDEHPISVGMTSIHNGKGSVNRKSQWVNKISVNTWRNNSERMTAITTHKAVTDPAFLHPLEEEFKALIEEFCARLDERFLPLDESA